MDRDETTPSRDLIDFERPRLDDPLYKDNPQPHGFAMNPKDGLPSPAVSVSMADTEAADLTPDRFVCMETDERRQCKYYKRQLLPSKDKANTVCLRFCTAITDEGARYTDLGDSEVLACEFRDPPDPQSVHRLAVFDSEVMRRQEERRKENEEFDVDKALENEDE